MHPWNIAHRGGALLMPENTLAAFADAQARGCDGVELDVQLTRDGIVVVHHDFRLKRDMTRLAGFWLPETGPAIRDLTWDELQSFDVGAARPGSPYALNHPYLEPLMATVPSLDEVMALTDQGFRLFVELKCDGSSDSADPYDLADAVLEVCGDRDNVIFVGFDWRALARIRQRAPDAECWFTTDRLQGDARPMIEGIAEAGGQGWFAHFWDATPDNIQWARNCGLEVGAWTVNMPDDMRRLMGLDAICTDRPDLLADL